MAVFENAFNEHFAEVYRFAFKRTGSSHIAEEVAQLTFIKLWQNRERLNEAVKLNHIIFRIATTTIIDEVRKQNNFKRLVGELGIQDIYASGTATPVQLENKDLIKSLLDKMPKVRRRVYQMSRMEGLTYEEIALELDISVKTVEKHISQAIKQVKSLRKRIYHFLLLFF